MHYIKITLSLLAIVMSALSITILKERVDKMDDLRIEIDRLEAVYKDVIKNAPSCLNKADKNPDCNSFYEVEDHLDQTKQQIIMIKRIEDHGVPASVCGSISSIASGLPGFEYYCYKYENFEECKKNKSKNNNCEFHEESYTNLGKNLTIYNSIKNNFRYLYLDRLPSEILYFMLVTFCSLIGMIYKIKSELKSFYELKIIDIVTSFSQGFIAYIFITGAKYVVAIGNQQFVTNINPYSVALVGCLAGMYFDRFFIIKPNNIN